MSGDTPLPPRPGRCRSCGASVYWVLTGSGALMPVDVDPVDGGNVRFVAQDLVEVVGPLEAELGDRPLFVSHFATCPNADEHRRPR